MKRKRLDPVSRADAALDQVVVLQAEIDALMARRTEAIREFEDAFTEAYPPSAAPFRERACRAELACALRVPERSAERLMGEARTLVERLPATLTGLADGRFSYRHAQTMVEELAGLSREDMAVVERVALGSAPVQTASRFRRTVRTLRERRDPSTMVQRVQIAFTNRDLTLDPASDGMACLTLYTNTVDATAIHDGVTRQARRELADGDPRTLAQLRADLFTDLLLGRNSGPNGRGGVFDGITPTVIVTVPVQTLLGGAEPGTMGGVGPIDALTARRLTSEAPGLYRLLTHPETGVALSLGRTRYQIPDGLRMWLRVRDGSCRFPMCGINTRRCDIDHTEDWAYDGLSDHDNLAHLSRGHHTLKHHGGWRVTQPRPGHLVWTSPLGRQYETLPDTG